MTDETESLMTVSVSVSQIHEYVVEDDEVPDGQSPQDVAFDRAVKATREQIIDWPGAFVEVQDIEDV